MKLTKIQLSYIFGSQQSGGAVAGIYLIKEDLVFAGVVFLFLAFCAFLCFLFFCARGDIHRTPIKDEDATMIALCVWRGVYVTSKDSDEILGLVDNPVTHDLEILRMVKEMVKPEYHEHLTRALEMTHEDINKGLI